MLGQVKCATRSRQRRFIRLLPALVAATLGFCLTTPTSAQTIISSNICICLTSVTCAQGQLVSLRKPDGLVLSTGNVYFTSHDGAGAAVWRTSQTSIPGQEIILYWEAGARFGDIVFAQVGSSFFGYFFAVKSGVITIRRVPLTGGNATVLATVTNVDIANSHRNLAVDRAHLYWQDDSAVRKMPIGGGAVTVLDQTTPNTPTAGIVLDGSRLIYASVRDIHFVPTTGANTAPLVRRIAEASSPVTALHVGLSGVYWAERSGALRVKRSGSPTINTLPSSTSLITTSISTNGVAVTNGVQSDAELAWTRCGSQSCELIKFPSAFGSTVAIDTDAIGVNITPIGNVFWGDAAGVHRRPFNQ